MNRGDPLELKANVAIIGAGVAGLVCATGLSQAGAKVTIFDKGRFPGGRLASRERVENSFDYGAQYFTARDEQFRKFLTGQVRNGVVARWTGKFGKITNGMLAPDVVVHPRYVGVPVMRSLAEELARGLNILQSHRVTEVSRQNNRWIVSGMYEHGENTESFSRDGYDFVVLNMPPTQAAVLYPNSELLNHNLLPCFALLLYFEERLKLDFDGIKMDDKVISWAARDSSKPGRSLGERWVIHASADWSQSNFDKSSDEIERLLIEKVATVLNLELPAARFTKLHKWRFALPASTLTSGCLLDRENALAYCGDWCMAPRVEGAYLSGLATASQVERSIRFPSVM